MLARFPSLVVLLLAGAACSTDSDIISTLDGGIELEPDVGMELDGGETDAGSPDADGPDLGPADTGAEPPSFCAQLGLTERPFIPGGSGYAFGDVAGDFTTRELDGATYTLSEAWRGCDSFIFVTFFPAERQAIFEPTEWEHIWDSSVDPLIATGLNAHYFFASWEETEADRVARVTSMRDRIETALAASNLDSETLARQRERFHYVIDDPRAVEGSISGWFLDYVEFYVNPASRVDLGDRGAAPPPFPTAIAIDRFQEWDSVGSLSQAVGAPPSLRMASYQPAFYDHKAALADRTAGETGVTVVELLNQEVTERIFTPQVALPSPAEMASFDTLEVDVSVFCHARNVFACSEWDRIARVDVCLDDGCSERRELVRWITPYWRRGGRRWLIDATALLGLLDGGPTRFRIAMGPNWERKTPRDVRVALRLSNRGVGDRPVGAQPAFGGGAFDANYNDRAPLTFTPPASATKVELVYILSGHGQAQGTNCAEWCDHRHRFAVNGTDLPLIRHRGEVGSLGGCGPLAARGVSPGQYGNWAPERAYWCPGLPVDHVRLDITELVNPGQENTLTYQAGLGSAAPGGGNISLSSYVVWSE